MRSGLVAALWLLGCSPEWDLPVREESNISVGVEPFGSLEQAPEVLRLRLRGALGRADLADFRLFRGELSDYHLGRLRAREVPGTLLEREVPLVVWVEAPELVVAPTEALAPGSYSLAAAELGLVASLAVMATGLPRLERLWPPPEHVWGGGLSVFGGDGAAFVAEAVVLEPAGTPAQVLAGLDEQGAFAERCVRVEPDPAPAALPEGALLLPPLLAGGVFFEPAPLRVRTSPEPAPPACTGTELALGPACASVEDDRIVLRAVDAASLWALEAPERVLAVAGPGQSLVVRGLAPGAPARVVGRAFDLAGHVYPLDVPVHAAPARTRLVVNEVLANPVGREASSEWVELVNDGKLPIDLAGFAFVDSGGTFALPDERLRPGEFALLVGPEFSVDPELDVGVPADVRRLPLGSLGKAGLANSGELLRLLAADGSVISRWPALAAPAPGQSLARREPGAPDAEAASFGPHAGLGASPGAPNELE